MRKKINYVLISPIFFIIILFLSPLLGKCYSAASTNSDIYTVITLKAEVYNDITLSEIFTTLSLGDEVELDGGEIIMSPVGIYLVKIFLSKDEENSYYIQQSKIAKVEKDNINMPTKNATIIKDAILFNFINDAYCESEISLCENTRVTIYSKYNSNAPFQYIGFENDGLLIFGYIQTEYITPDGVSPYFITAISISLAIIGIIMALLFIKKKN